MPEFCVVEKFEHPAMVLLGKVAFALEPVTCKRFRNVTNSVLKLLSLCCKCTASFEEDASVNWEGKDKMQKYYEKTLNC